MFGGRRQVLLSGTILIIVVIVAALSTITTSYEPYRLTDVAGSNQTCELHYERCTCLGSLRIAESYPEQFFCSGPSICRDINRTVCPSPVS